MDNKEFLDVCFEIARQTSLRGFLFDGLHADGSCDGLVCYFFFGLPYLSDKDLKPFNDFELHYDIVRADKFGCALMESVPDFCTYVVSVYHPNYMPF